MLINEVCKECSLTKKAVEYYVEQGLVRPSALQNGYRDFSEDDIAALKKIGVLRGLGLDVKSIRAALDTAGTASMRGFYRNRRMELDAESKKLDILQRLYETNDWEYARTQLDSLKRSETVLQRLREAFPGFYGDYIALHFAGYLNEPIQNLEQLEAFNTITDFLDGVKFELEPELEMYLDEVMADLDAGFADRVSASMEEAISDTDGYISEHRDILEWYMQIRNSPEFMETRAYKLQAALRKLNSENGYDTVFIPAMKRLSPSYRKYHDGMEKANGVFLQHFPDAIMPR